MLLPGKGIPWKEFLRDLQREWVKDKIDTVAGGLTFFGVLAIFPFLLFAVSLAGLILARTTTTALVNELYRVVPRAVADILSERINALAEGQSSALLTFSALGAIWTASGGIIALADALNTAYGVEDTRPFWKRRGLAIIITIGGAVFAVAATAIAVATPSIAAYFPGPLSTVILWARLPVSALIIMTILAVLYYLLPDVEQEFKFITPGSVVAVVIWVVASLGFSFYVGRFGTYEVIYGALGGVIIFLLWMWISAMAVLLGAEINAILEHRSPEAKEDEEEDEKSGVKVTSGQHSGSTRPHASARKPC